MLTRANHDKKSTGNSMEIYIVIAIALVIIVGGTYFYNTKNTAPSPESPPITAAEPITEQQPVAPAVEEAAPVTEPAPEPEPEPELIVEQSEPAPAIELPTLDNSDGMALESAQQLSWLPTYASLLNTKNVIRNFVTFIDNLSRGELVAKFSPLIKPSEKFSVTELDNRIFLNEESYSRYDLYVDIVNSINVEFAMSQYAVLKPLFDEAYQELGYQDNSFDNALFRAIETALNAPIIREPIELVAPSVMYKFADPELEQLPSAQKLLIRMGPNNMIKLRAKLQQIQHALE